MQDFYSRVLGFPITDEGLLGTQRLRGYRSNRSCNSYTNFQGAAFLWYVMEVQEAFDYLVQRGSIPDCSLRRFGSAVRCLPTPVGIGGRISARPPAWGEIAFQHRHQSRELGFSREGSKDTVQLDDPF